RTGKRLWMHKMGRRHRSSLLCAGGLLYVTSTEGDTYVVRAGPKFELLAENPLGEECYASPAAAQGNLFIRTAQHLWCLGGAEERKNWWGPAGRPHNRRVPRPGSGGRGRLRSPPPRETSPYEWEDNPP